jgi:hypothetical protein
MTLILIVLLVLVIAGGGYGWRAGYTTIGDPLGLVLLVVVVLLLLGAFGGPRWGWW